MKLTVLSTALVFAVSSANPHFARNGEWAPAGPDDFRGPCPMMNTLANHNFLPHDGRNLTKANVVKGLGDGLNFDADLASIMWEQAIIANPEPNATFFTLDHLNRHNVLEHDASMSRTDAFFGNNHIFNSSVFATTTRYWIADILDANQLANGKLFRQVESKAFNPNYTFSSSTENFSLGEVAAPVIVFGDMTAGTVSKDLVLYFFENERLPEELGWSKKTAPITLQNISSVVSIIASEVSLLTDSGSGNSSAHGATRRDNHFGLQL